MEQDEENLPQRYANNATFLIFKKSGKYYERARGYLPSSVFTPIYHGGWYARETILNCNGGRCPGLADAGDEFTLVINPDEDCPHGWPILLAPRN